MKSMMKRTLILGTIAAIASFGTISQGAPAQTIQIDFGTNEGSATDATWNTFGSGNLSGKLTDSSGNAAGLSLSITNGSNIVPTENTLTSSLPDFATRDGMPFVISNNLVFTIDGFNPNESLDLSLWQFNGSFNTFWGTVSGPVDINGTQFTLNVNDSAPTTRTIVADANGELTFTGTGFSGTNVVSINALVIDRAIPEPSSLALLGLGGLMIARRRRG